MSTAFIRANTAEMLSAIALSSAGTLLTGLTTLRVRVRRGGVGGDNFIFDWSDNTFKAGPVTPLGTLLEVSATNDPGHYAISWPGAAAGEYVATITQTGADAANLPAAVTLKVGGVGALDASTVDALVWGAALPGAYGADTAGERLATTDGRVDVTVSTRAAPGAAMALTAGERTTVQALVLSDATPFPGARVDVAISSRSTLAAADVWAVGTRELTGVGASGIATAVNLALVPDAVWDELLAGHLGDGAAGTALAAAGDLSPASASAIAAAVWATPEGSPVAGSYGDDLQLLRQHVTNRLVASAGTVGNLVLYADNGTTPRLTWSVTDSGGNTVTAPPGSPTRRSAAA